MVKKCSEDHRIAVRWSPVAAIRWISRSLSYWIANYAQPWTAAVSWAAQHMTLNSAWFVVSAFCVAEAAALTAVIATSLEAAADLLPAPPADLPSASAPGDLSPLEAPGAPTSAMIFEECNKCKKWYTMSPEKFEEHRTECRGSALARVPDCSAFSWIARWTALTAQFTSDFAGFTRFMLIGSVANAAFWEITAALTALIAAPSALPADPPSAPPADPPSEDPP